MKKTKLQKACDGLRDSAPRARRETVASLRAKLEAARKAIEAQPHHISCAGYWTDNTRTEYVHCDCWKAAALREIGEGACQ